MLSIPRTRLTAAGSLSRRAKLAQLAFITAIVLVFSCALILFNAYRLHVRLAERADSIAHLAKTSLASAVWQVDHASARDFIDAVLQDEDVAFAQVVTGREIMASKSRPRFTGHDFEYFARDKRFLTRSVEIRKYGDWIGSFNLAMSTEGYIQEMGMYVALTFALGLLLILALTVAAIRYMRKHFLNPLTALEESATTIADGNLDASIDTSASNELGSLARAIDDMRQSVKHLINDLKEANAKLQNHQNLLESTVKERTEELKSKNESLNAALEDVRSAKKAAEVANLAKSSFLASMSHEIRTPMNAILGMADILWETELSEAQARYVDVFRTAGENLLEILDDILDLSKIEAGHLELEHTWFVLGEVLDKTCGVINTKAEQKGLTLSCTMAPDIPSRLTGDPSRLRQILINLLGNAVKFTDKGSVSLAVDLAAQEGEQVLLHFSITDTGVGVAGDKLGAIFEAFTQADSSTTRQFGGTGLGLAISKELSHMMGGRIWAESTPGKGSTFHFTARFGTAGQPAQARTPDQTDETAALPPINILMLEDSKYNAFVTQIYLQSTPCRLTVAEDGKTGVEMFKKGGWDLVLMDIQMPVMDGFQATRAIRDWEREQKLPPTPIVAMTAFALDEDARRCRDAGADYHLPKPVKKSALFETIHLLAGKDGKEPGGTDHD
ncbi:ATP-binding protein [Pseudodesulfovibrio indicus]|uniref:Sensory/regulatory protein RpfC n=1 Tax=Pseudodesulfovibrio indicus TaxID=1716143 RepID=A0A126QL93_9BACT|nr:ATP-binding protein [Pseudodesulfovibrio indicus]AMK10724.1 hybrid sensor histidine kinase/response regulator [Pseudodesulfovibrio indicus]TDT91708.1 TMAO reductase system sensor TorS [Pseudodesulfovibrio indicus]